MNVIAEIRLQHYADHLVSRHHHTGTWQKRNNSTGEIVAALQNICDSLFMEQPPKKEITMLYYTTFNTLFCDIILVGDGDGIRQLHLDTGEGTRQFTISKEWQRDDTLFSYAQEQIEAYFRGERTAFTIPLQLAGTEFQKKVWAALCAIPFGETRTYGEIAKSIGNKNGSRAVGNANSKNPIPLLVPCHRVIGANGKLTGFAHGLSIKQKLLTLEETRTRE